jgi:protein-tyrosine phosphatase
VFCTTHNGYSAEDGEEYDKAFELLQQAVKEAEIDVKLHKGCEVLCAAQYMDDIIYGLDEGIFQTLGNTKYVLTELYPDAKPSEALHIIKTLIEHGYKPIIAHMERNFNITGAMVGVLIQNGALIQVNAISFQDDSDEQYQNRAKELLANRYIHFVGSDSHRINHRPPKIQQGIQYILDNTDNGYALQILNGNAESLFSVVLPQIGNLHND